MAVCDEAHRKVLTMKQDLSKGDQTAGSQAVRFGEFRLIPAERLLVRNGAPVPLAPKAFDALRLLTGASEHLLTKQALMETLWPDTFVAEANLTNIIVSLRKVLGPDAILTVTGHGYRFALAVQAEPDGPDAWHERLAHARELISVRSHDSLVKGRDLLWMCLAEQPSSAVAWMCLGRCHWILSKTSRRDAAGGADLARAALRRALLLDPDLPAAHQLMATVDADSGQARSALSRLQRRVAERPDEAETFAALVQVCRYCGLIDESLEAHRRAVRINPAIVTSLPHTLFLNVDYAGTLDTYGGRAGYYLDAACWAALGHEARARELLRKRLETMPLAGTMHILMASLSAALEGRRDEAMHLATEADAYQEPEGLVYLARHCSYLRNGDAALRLLENAAEKGFTCAPSSLLNDPWLACAREKPDFRKLLMRTEKDADGAHRLYAATCP